MGLGDFLAEDLPAVKKAGSATYQPTPQPMTGPAPTWGDFFTGLNSPQMTLLDQQRQRQQDRYGLALANQGLNSGFLNRGFGNDLAALGLQREQIGLDRKDIAAELSAIAKYRGLANELLGSQMRGFAVDEGEAKQRAGRNRFDLRSNLTARGAFLTPALGRGDQRISEDLWNAVLRINEGRTQAGIGNRREMTGLDLQESRARNRAAGLDIATRRLGIDEDQLRLGLEQGLANLGLGTLADINSIFEALGSTDQQRAALAAQILQGAMSMSGVPFPGTQTYYDSLFGG